jgi:hypothetical protein
MQVLLAFEPAGLEYVLIGAAAMAFHGLVRATAVSIFHSRYSREYRTSSHRTARGFPGRSRDNAISSEDLLGEYSAVRYVPPTGNLYLDVLTRLGEAASFETVEAEIKNVDGTLVRVATPEALYRLKKGTVRLQDHADAAALRERFNLRDEK